MSNLFQNSPILSLATNEKLRVQGAVIITPTAINTKKKGKAHRRQQRRKRAPKQDDRLVAMLGENKRVKLPKKQRRAEKANYKALVKKMKKQTITADKTEKKKAKLPIKAIKKQSQISEPKNGGMLPEEKAYKRSLRLNRKDHALREESQVARKEVKKSLVDTLTSMQKEATQKRTMAIIHGPLPEERAYRESIGADPDAFLSKFV